MTYEQPTNESDLFPLERICSGDMLEVLCNNIKDVTIHHTALDQFGNDEIHVILEGSVVARNPGY